MRTSNKMPEPGDKVLRYKYRDHEHEDLATGEVEEQAGPAVGGGFYVILKDSTVVAVEVWDTHRKEWIEKRPRFEGSPVKIANAKH